MNKEADNGLANSHEFHSCDLRSSRFLFLGTDAMVDMADEWLDGRFVKNPQRSGAIR